MSALIAGVGGFLLVKIVGYKTHVTVAGDTYDIIALDYYNDEFKAPLIADANLAHSDVVIFSAGVELRIPVIEQVASSKLPPWRQV